MTISRFEASVVLAAITVAQENPSLIRNATARRLLAVRAVELFELQNEDSPNRTEDTTDAIVLGWLRDSLILPPHNPSLPIDKGFA